MNYIDAIKKYIPKCEQEVCDKNLILELIEKEKDKILTRDIKYAHITSSGLVLNKNFDKVLMVYHNIYNSWSWTGGHADGIDDLYSIALREVMEETGVKNLIPISNDIISIEVLPVEGHIKRGKYVSCHLHLNATYVFFGDEDEKTQIKEDENSGVMWIKIDELEKYCTEVKMIDVYRKIIKSAKNI